MIIVFLKTAGPSPCANPALHLEVITGNENEEIVHSSRKRQTFCSYLTLLLCDSSNKFQSSFPIIHKVDNVVIFVLLHSEG